MQKIRQIPLLLILIASSMLCVGSLQLIRGQTIFTGQSRNVGTPAEVLGPGSGSPVSADPAADAIPDPSPDTDTGLHTDMDAEDPAAGSSGQADPDQGQEEVSRTYEFSEVTSDYLDDALFIEDSRVVGVQLYSGWDNLTYYAESGLTVYNIFDREVVPEGNQTITIEEALQNHSFGKIYLEIGINEMGTGTVDSFMKQYESVVSHLRELQPDAILFLCGIMVVTEARSDTDDIFNNPNIRQRNERIAALADQTDIFYLDFNEVVMDENGNLNTDYTWDAVHLLGKYDSLWLAYFLQHGIVK